MPRESSLKQYVETSKWRSPFMTEVARIAVLKGIGQQKLAEMYGKASGTDTQSCHVKRHFERKTTHKRVCEGYANALGMSPNHILLLTEGRVREPNIEDLRPNAVALLFEAEAVASAINLMNSDQKLFGACMYAAELAMERHSVVPDSDLAPTLPIDPDIVNQALIPPRYVVGWAAIAQTLRTVGFDLVSKIRQKDAKQIKNEELLLTLFSEISEAVGNFIGKGNQKLYFGAFTYYEWKLIEDVLTFVLRRHGLPETEMLKRLNESDAWRAFCYNRLIPHAAPRDLNIPTTNAE